MWRGELGHEPTLCRVQSAPPAWSAFGPSCSSLASTMRGSLEAIASEGAGALVLMHLGATAENIEAQFAEDFGGEAEPVRQAHVEALRDLGTGCQILLDLGLRELRLLTRSERPIVGLEAYGLNIVERVAAF